MSHRHACTERKPIGSDRNTTTKAASLREQLGPANSQSNEGRQAKNGGVKGSRDGSAEELDRETGDEKTTVGRTRTRAGHVERMADDRLPKRAAGLREKREANAEMGGLCKERYEEHRREGRHEEEDRRQRRVGNTSR